MYVKQAFLALNSLKVTFSLYKKKPIVSLSTPPVLLPKQLKHAKGTGHFYIEESKNCLLHNIFLDIWQETKKKSFLAVLQLP